MNFVGFVMAIASHDDSVFKFIINGFLNFNGLRCFSSESLALVGKPDHLLINQLETIVNREVFADVVNNQVNTALEDPR
jgi:hypothetical protein